MSHPPIRLPRWLGTPSPKTRSRDGEREDKPAFLIYEWDEHSFAPKPQESRQRAEDVMRRLPERGVVLILGVPGQGKSTLLKEWQKNLERPTLLGECGLLTELENRADILLEILRQDSRRKPRQLIEQLEQGKLEKPVILIDALDELRTHNRWPSRLAQAVKEASESALVVLSCRTHVWNSQLENLFNKELSIPQPYTLLGFTALEQEDYLVQWAEVNEKPKATAKELAKNIKGNAQLKSLAANALLLDLIARVALDDTTHAIRLPASRADFYDRAVENLW
ncbi:MAG: NACHT domain-containing protein [Meiothermus sp.]|nr:NACHT domain-containing protein [Meiothermus sp.]